MRAAVGSFIIIAMRARELVPVFCATFLLASCSDRGQEMEEKVTQMQRQLDEAQKQLQAANQALAARTPAQTTTQTTSTLSGGLPSREVVEESYATSVNAFRERFGNKPEKFPIGLMHHSQRANADRVFSLHFASFRLHSFRLTEKISPPTFP